MGENEISKKDVLGFEGLYLVTNTGKIISHNYLHHGITRELKQMDNGTGYLYVVLQKNKKRFKKYVHRIVLEAFKGKSTLDSNHKDFNRKNNHINNLEYVTKSENQRHQHSNRPRRRNEKGQFISV